MFSATHFLKGPSCLNSPGTPQRVLAALRRQLNLAEKSVIASISQAEERHFKTLQLPALRAVVSEPAQQKRRFFLLLFLSASANSRNEAQTVGGAWLLPSAERGHTAAHRAKHGWFFLLSAFRSTGRPKWVRASARNCGWRIAGRDACPSAGDRNAPRWA